MRATSLALHARGVVLPGDAVRDVFIVGGRLTFAAQDDAVTVLDGGYLVPGLVDAHAHLSLASPAGDAAEPRDRVLASARAQLAAGVLAVREPGSPDRASRGIGPADGLPRTVTAGRFLAAPGRYFPGLAREVAPDELPAAAVEEATASGAWAKVIADFPVPSGRIEPSFPVSALAEAARQVHALDRQITAHASCQEAIEACLDAGFDAIEHGTQARTEHLAVMAERGVCLVPTLIIGAGILAAVSSIGWDEAAVASLRRDVDAQPGRVRWAAEHGVKVLAGTDAGMGPHGMVGTEIGLLLAAGLPPGQALGAGSWIARQYLGLPGIDEGAPADLVGYADDPRQDPEVLSRPAMIMLDGKTVTR
jgi:imidazolonepropionase-like amidohydrolase